MLEEIPTKPRPNRNGGEHCAILRSDASLLAGLFKQSLRRYQIIENGLPEDAVVIGVHIEAGIGDSSGTVDLLIESASFAFVPNGFTPPVLLPPTAQRLD